MKKLASVLMGGLLLVGAVACDNASRTSQQAPQSTNTTTQAPESDEAQDTNKDANSEVRRRQLESDTRAREQRNEMLGDKGERSDDDIQSEVRNKLEANLPASQLAVEAEDGNVTISGTVPTQPQLQRIEPLAKEINGVENVVVKVSVAPAKR